MPHPPSASGAVHEALDAKERDVLVLLRLCDDGWLSRSASKEKVNIAGIIDDRGRQIPGEAFKGSTSSLRSFVLRQSPSSLLGGSRAECAWGPSGQIAFFGATTSRRSPVSPERARAAQAASPAELPDRVVRGTGRELEPAVDPVIEPARRHPDVRGEGDEAA